MMLSPKSFLLTLFFGWISADISTQAATIAHWKFDDSGTWLQDSSGNGYNLTNGNTAGATYTSGAVNFTGGGTNTLSTANAPVWTDNSFTIEALIRPDDVSSLKSIAGHYENNLGKQWLFLINEGKLSIIFDGVYHSLSTVTMVQNHDYYVAAAINLAATNAADRITFYLQDITNGTALVSGAGSPTTTATSVIASTSPFAIGSTGHASSRFDGLISEVRFSDTNLGIGALLVPEPSRLILLGLGGLLALGRKRRG